MDYGFNGKILRVDLTTRAITIEEPGEDFYRTHFGGTNLIACYLLNEVRPGVDPLGPENKLIFATGPITGAPVAGSGRNGVGAKSPLTGGFGDSQAGGFFGAELKHAGFDAIIVEGRSETPVYLLVVDGKAEIRDAADLWGKTTAQAEAAIRQEVGDRHLRFATIGPGGERLVLYASILNDLTHAAGRTGMGAVMGSKRLKAIAVRGHGGPKYASPERVQELGRWMSQNWKNYSYALHDLGTANIVMGLDAAGGLPTRNFREGSFEGAERLSGEAMKDSILVGRGSCYACPIRCKREVKVGEPWNVDSLYGGPEYETIGAVGSCCGIDDLGAVAKASEICNAYGIDTISTGASIAFAMECFENGLLTERDTDGLRLTFGNAEAMVRMVEMIAQRRGLGDLLAEGVKRAAAKIGRGAERFAMHVKGQELPMHEPRLKAGLGVGYALSATGADHVHNIHDPMYAGPGAPLERVKSMGILSPLPVHDISERKMRVFYYDGIWRYLTNSLVTCILVPWTPAQVTEMVNAITGWNSTFLEIHKVGERSITLQRLFNLREGFTAADDSLPQRLFQPFERGPLAGHGMDERLHREALVTLYGMLGWTADGVPTPAKLAELNLSWAAGAVPGLAQ
ncbi:MAG: aldehyde ferredoxin oxidoreductase family protein [Sphingomonadaceae bacterium]